jgi:hypothetical protein
MAFLIRAEDAIGLLTMDAAIDAVERGSANSAGVGS